MAEVSLGPPGRMIAWIRRSDSQHASVNKAMKFALGYYNHRESAVGYDNTIRPGFTAEILFRVSGMTVAPWKPQARSIQNFDLSRLRPNPIESPWRSQGTSGIDAKIAYSKKINRG